MVLSCCGLSGEMSCVWERSAALPGSLGRDEGIAADGEFQPGAAHPSITFGSLHLSRLGHRDHPHHGGWRCLPGSSHSQELMDKSRCSSVMLWTTFGMQQNEPTVHPFLPCGIPEGSAPRPRHGVRAPCQQLQGSLLAKHRHLPAGFMGLCQGLWDLLTSIY